MKSVRISIPEFIDGVSVSLTGSKSETNRLLILSSLFKEIELLNDSNAHDVQVMRKALNIQKGEVDIHHAGTAMRFLTAYFAAKEGAEVVLTGSDRMKERPIEVLVNALRSLGASIEYLEREGYPPLKIVGGQFHSNRVQIKADVSSQYISALCLIGATLTRGLHIELLGEITSLPYLNMSIQLLKRVGIQACLEGSLLSIEPTPRLSPVAMAVESDWSAASYYYSIIALAPPGSTCELSVLREDSLQGDRILADLYRDFGVETEFLSSSIRLRRTEHFPSQPLSYDLKGAPDIAQTIAVTAAGLGVDCYMEGLHTLPIKETDRLFAMKEELQACGVHVDITDSSMQVWGAGATLTSTTIRTYNDHRMAMAFAPLALKIGLEILDPQVVEKSYPDFWRDLSKLGFCLDFAG